MRRWRDLFLKAAGALLGLVVLYVLSFGPVYAYASVQFAESPRTTVDRNEKRLEAVLWFYQPITYVCRRNAGVGDLMKRYFLSFHQRLLTSPTCLAVPPEP